LDTKCYSMSIGVSRISSQRFSSKIRDEAVWQTDWRGDLAAFKIHLKVNLIKIFHVPGKIERSNRLEPVEFLDCSVLAICVVPLPACKLAGIFSQG